MESPLVIIIDARNVERDTQYSQALRVAAPLRERDGGCEEQLRQSRQLRLCYEHCRGLYPGAQIDIFINRDHYMNAHSDADLAAIRELDACAFQKVPSAADVDRMILTHALNVKDGFAVVISNDRFRDHISKGLITSVWAENHIWNFMFVRGAFVLDTRFAVASPPGEDAWRLWHERADNSGTPTSLRPDPNMQSQPSPERIVQSFEQVSVIGMHSTVVNCSVVTWVKIRSTSGEGWIQEVHLHKSRKMIHRRVDNCSTALRAEPRLLCEPLQNLAVQPLSTVDVLSRITEISPVNGEEIDWVNVKCETGQGWLKRSNLAMPADPSSSVPASKKQRTEFNALSRRFHLRNLGYGDSADRHIEDLKAVLAAHDLGLKWHSSPRERQCETIPDENIDLRQSLTPDLSTVKPMGPPQPPPLARWYVPELSISGNPLSLERLIQKDIVLIVDGVKMEFKPPLEKTSSRQGKPRAKYNALAHNTSQLVSSGGLHIQHSDFACSQVERSCANIPMSQHAPPPAPSRVVRHRRLDAENRTFEKQVASTSQRVPSSQIVQKI